MFDLPPSDKRHPRYGGSWPQLEVAVAESDFIHARNLVLLGKKLVVASVGVSDGIKQLGDRPSVTLGEPEIDRCVVEQRIRNRSAKSFWQSVKSFHTLFRGRFVPGLNSRSVVVSHGENHASS